MTLPLFSHIYIEDRVRESSRTSHILEKFPKSIVIPIRHHKEIFNRPRQDWELQRRSRNLILAHRDDQFLYPGSAYTPDFGAERFFYNTLVMNCIYDCEYCYLQGLYPSGNVVAFLNNEEYLEATRRELRDGGPLYLCISYDTDLLAFETIFPYCTEWLRFARQQPTLLVELRTKSVHITPFEEEEPIPNWIFAWTVSPDEVVRLYEKKTPSLNSRLECIRRLKRKGWRVRLCIDPMIAVSNWREVYQDFATRIHEKLADSPPDEISIGVFRVNWEFLQNMRKRRSTSALLHYPYAQRAGVGSYAPELEDEMKSFFRQQLVTLIPEDRIFI